jgi:hypothetical protein
MPGAWKRPHGEHRATPHGACHVARSRVAARCACSKKSLTAALECHHLDAMLPLVLTRRRFLEAAGAVLTVLGTPIGQLERGLLRIRGGFLTACELDTLDALCERILPADEDPGAKALGASHYIHALLTALDGPLPTVFTGGPFSGRQPYPDVEHGTASDDRPPDAFRHFAPLGRLERLAWRAELYGSASVPELAALDVQQGGPKKGLRDVYREGLEKVDAVARATQGDVFRRLLPPQQDAVLTALDAPGVFPPDPRRGNRTFMDHLIQHTLEGCFAAPEYGGNRDARGWAMLGVEGDSQPLGFSLFSRTAGDYHERPDHPVSTPNPDERDAIGALVPRPLTADGQHVQQAIVALTRPFTNGAG